MSYRDYTGLFKTDEKDFILTEDGLLKKYDGCGGTVVVPGGVTVVDRFAFKDGEVVEVTLPEGVTEIRDNAFCGCKKLERINLPSSLRIIGFGAFYGCAALESIDIPYTVESIGNSAFSCCGKLRHVVLPSACKYLNTNLFYRCLSLKSVYIPESFVVAYYNAINECENVEIYMETEPTERFVDTTVYTRTPDYNGDEIIQADVQNWNPQNRPVHTHVSRAEYDRIVGGHKN